MPAEVDHNDIAARIHGFYMEAEHDGWTAARHRHGWNLADQKNIDRRESHLLVSYSGLLAQIRKKQAAVGPQIHKQGPMTGLAMTLDEEVELEKVKDNNPIRKYIDIVARTSYPIVMEE